MEFKTKMSLKEWLENYWYHYKWATILGLFFFFVLLVGVAQCSSRVSADVIFMYSGPESLSLSEIQALEESAVSIMEEDYNEDGKQYIQYLENIVLFDNFSVKDETGTEQIIINKTEHIERYVTQVAAGDAQIYFLSPEVYSELSKQNVLVPLSEILGSVPVEAHDSSSFRLGTLGIYSLPGFCELPEDTLVCLRAQKTLAVFDEESAKKEHEWAEKLFLTLISYQND